MHCMYVALFRITSLGTGSSLQDAIERVVAALEDTDVRFEVGPMATTLEADDLDTVFAAVKAAHEALVDASPRIEMELTIDHRIDKEETMTSLRSGVPDEHLVARS